MKIILTEDQYEQLTEMIKLDIKVGDTIMGGKFKNKKVVVKTIGKNDKGDITINGKPLLRFRIIKESNPAVLRRQNRIDELFHDYLLSHNVTPQDSFDSFFQTLCWNIAVTIVDRTNMDNDSYVTLRNQIIRFIKNNYYEEFKGWWERRQKRMGISKNINESNEKNKNFLKDKFGIDLDGKIRMIQSYEDLPLVFASHFYPKSFNRMLNDGGPFYVLNINKGYKIGNTYVNKLYLYRPRVDGSSYLVDQDGYNKSESTFLENLGIDVMGLTIEDLIDLYFNEEDQI